MNPGQTRFTVTPIMSDPWAEWCGACKAPTLIVSRLLLLTPYGVTPRETYAWCEICDDPAFQEETGRGRRRT
jgi:hypothetical protein